MNHKTVIGLGGFQGRVNQPGELIVPGCYLLRSAVQNLLVFSMMQKGHSKPSPCEGFAHRRTRHGAFLQCGTQWWESQQCHLGDQQCLCPAHLTCLVLATHSGRHCGTLHAWLVALVALCTQRPHPAVRSPAAGSGKGLTVLSMGHKTNAALSARAAGCSKSS